jgi:mannosyltransferase OCH1-like enzyme
MRVIPNTIFQTSIEKPEKCLVDKIIKKCPDWTYKHFNDEEIISFFNENYIEEFKDIVKKFNNMPTGAHKADLFRYYYLYLNGGVFIDSDAMIEVNIEDVVQDYEKQPFLLQDVKHLATLDEMPLEEKVKNVPEAFFAFAKWKAVKVEMAAAMQYEQAINEALYRP